jgi:hypothetical protein
MPNPDVVTPILAEDFLAATRHAGIGFALLDIAKPDRRPGGLGRKWPRFRSPVKARPAWLGKEPVAGAQAGARRRSASPGRVRP